MLLLPLKPSRVELGLLLGTHCAALLALLFTSLPASLLLLMVLALLLSLWQSVRRWLGAGRPHLCALTIAAHHSLLHYSRTSVRMALPSVQFYSEFLIVLRFAPEPDEGKSGGSIRFSTRRVVLLPDSMPEEASRRLRCFLRFQRPV